MSRHHHSGKNLCSLFHRLLNKRYPVFLDYVPRVMCLLPRLIYPPTRHRFIYLRVSRGSVSGSSTLSPGLLRDHQTITEPYKKFIKFCYFHLKAWLIRYIVQFPVAGTINSYRKYHDLLVFNCFFTCFETAPNL